MLTRQRNRSSPTRSLVRISGDECESEEFESARLAYRRKIRSRERTRVYVRSHDLRRPLSSFSQRWVFAANER
ncbi:hypothetical protein AR158_c221L [Paramecium bursaria Chlorella virus AR158]|uniref:hypothetical protein n=1 Tax=Paramecium bursaria Chlorella virus AR158 TaxID=380598 RepID=UPI00015AA879|nr:hypothetical protein AR158_c221L [Paramecium bursaria Chlorella virus AR158]ABU43767.1 hypothetical protein AR158_c221L [Paramecium bursaria Chlorella virus AR158]